MHRPALAALPLLLAPLAAEAGSTTVLNRTNETVTVFWRATGCKGTDPKYTTVCTSKAVGPWEAASYTWPAAATGDFAIGASCAPTAAGKPKSWPTTTPDWTLNPSAGTCSLSKGRELPAPRDKKATLTVSEGTTGSWRYDAECPAGTFVNTVQLRSQVDQGEEDDSGLSSIKFGCKPPGAPATTAATDLVSHDGYLGTWAAPIMCMDPLNDGLHPFVTGARLKVHAAQGAGDDLGATDVQFKCKSAQGDLMPAGGLEEGDWSGWATCPADSAVCGLGIRLEDSQGSGDDSGMTGLKLACCPL